MSPDMLADGWACVFREHFVGELAVDDESLARALAQLATQLGETSVGDRFARFAARLASLGVWPLGELAIHDLHLAFRCAEKETSALADFERSNLNRVCEAVGRRVGFADAKRDELQQQLRILLFTDGVERKAKIAEYSGRGELDKWLRVVAFRLALRMMKRDPARREAPELDEFEEHRGGLSPALGSDPELAFVRAEYRELFGNAARDALKAIPAKDRLILKQYFVDGLSIDALAQLHGGHRSSAHRSVQAAQERLSAECRELVRARIQMTETEIQRVQLLSEIRALVDGLAVGVAEEEIRVFADVAKIGFERIVVGIGNRFLSRILAVI